MLPEIREFERASTTALNAYLQPVVGDYLARLDGALAEQRFAGQFHIVQSNGGVMSTETARRLPVRTALSGPAAGVIAGAAIARAAGYHNVITCDLGGTSFDVSVVAGGRTALAAQTTVDFGLVIRTPMVEITTIGAGGGSIAAVDRGGLLQVGPESAGSVPGPACYGRGNVRPTLTDAQVVLGRINAERPIGETRLDVAAARAAIAAHVGAPLGLDVMQAAEAIVRVAEARMAGAIRLVSIERGHDPAKFAAMPFGGGGALHASALIKEIGLQCAVIPRFPGITSALGCVIADLRHDQVQTVNLALDGLDAAALDRRMVVDGEQARAVVAQAGMAVERIDVLYELDMHYLGQTHTVAVPLPVTLQGDDDRRHRADRARRLRGRLCGSVQPPAAGHSGAHRVLAHRRDRPPAGLRSRRARAGSGRIPGDGVARHPPGLVRRRLARRASLAAARASGGRRDRGAGGARAAGRHRLHRARPARPRRRLGQSDRRAKRVIWL